MRTRIPVALFSLLVLAVVAGIALAQAGQTLILNGKTASTRVRVIDGAAYVPVADVASALGMAVTKGPNGYELAVAGGANQVKGLSGKVGDDLFDGYWRFKVARVEEVPSYKAVLNQTDTRTFEPKGAGESLIAIYCTLKNGRTKPYALSLNAYGADWQTQLADDQGSAYTLRYVDMRTGDGGPYGTGGLRDWTQTMLPGAKTDMVLLFAVPKGAKLKDLVFTLRHSESGTGPFKANNLRIAMPQP